MLENENDTLFMKHLSLAGLDFSSLERSKTTNVRGFAGGDVT